MKIISKENPFSVNTGDYRKDGTHKGLGYFGILWKSNGKVATEMSIDVDYNGKTIEIPALVPTLNKEEVSYLLNGNNPTDEIINKAIEHAQKRLSENKSPFA